MRKMKKISLLLATLMTFSVVSTACDSLLGASPFSESLSESEHTDIEENSSIYSFEEESSTDFGDSVIPEDSDSASDEASSSDERDSGYDSSTEEEEYDEELLRMQQLIDLAYELSYGETMDGSYTLTGTIKSIQKGSKYIADVYVKGREDFPIQCYNLLGDTAPLRVGDIITVFGTIKNYKGQVEFDSPLLLNYILQDMPNVGGDPYQNVSASEFYASYTPATSNEDAYFRTLHGFMSGSIVTPDQEPKTSSYQPKNGNKFVRNSEMLFDESGKEYTVVDAYGNEAFKVYKDGAYIDIEEVAAYVYAFGTYPANYTESKKTKPTDSVWGEYLRVNHSSFSGSRSKFPYEPALPNITGCGGKLNYYEMDIGTTGTDCDPSYPITIYNNGYSITRGAARIVYGKADLDKDGVYEIGEHHVFYTYNHYNDFQEYLNYVGGWGEMFGNITGGGSLSSDYHYNPTDYVQVSLQPIASYATVAASVFYENYHYRETAL